MAPSWDADTSDPLLASVAIAGALVPVSATAQDTTPPVTEIISGPGDGSTRENQPVFNLESTELGSTFTCMLDAIALVPCGSVSYQPPQPLAEGAHVLRAFATDPAGNTDPIGSRRDFTGGLSPLVNSRMDRDCALARRIR